MSSQNPKPLPLWESPLNQVLSFSLCHVTTPLLGGKADGISRLQPQGSACASEQTGSPAAPGRELGACNALLVQKSSHLGQWVKTLAVKSDDQSSVPRTPIIKEEEESAHRLLTYDFCMLTYTHTHARVCICTHTCTINKCLKSL